MPDLQVVQKVRTKGHLRQVGVTVLRQEHRQEVILLRQEHRQEVVQVTVPQGQAVLLEVWVEVVQVVQVEVVQVVQVEVVQEDVNSWYTDSF